MVLTENDAVGRVDELPNSSDNCICPTGRVERFTQAAILLHLARHPSHGYDLLASLRDFGLGEGLPDLATLYKNLRRMEERGLLVSEWQAGEAGPGRRSYGITPKGLRYLALWVEALAQGQVVIDRFLAEAGQIVGVEAAKEISTDGDDRQ